MQVTTADHVLDIEVKESHRARGVLGQVIFFSMLGLLLLTAIPYGTAEPWWKAVFVMLVFLLSILWIIEGFLSGSWATGGGLVLLPPILLAALAMVQTISFGVQPSTVGGIRAPLWSTISADPYETRFFILQLLALVLAGAMLFRYASSEARTRTLIHLVIGVAVASAVFGLLRQTTQHSAGFGLPHMRPDVGYGQFINKNHFAFLMEMALGLALGMIIGGGVKRERALIYFACLLPIWTALVLCNSRGGLVAMLAELVAAALLLPLAISSSRSRRSRSKLTTTATSLPVRLALFTVLIIGVVLGTVWLGGDRLISKLAEGTADFDPVATELRKGATRNYIWAATWRMFEDRPIAGVGMGGYWAAIPSYHNASGAMTPQEAHNDYLELLVSGGVIGFAIGIWFLLSVYKRIRNNLRSRDRFRGVVCFAATLGIIGVAVHSLFDFGLHLIVNALVFVVLLVIATSPSEREIRIATFHG